MGVPSLFRWLSRKYPQIIIKANPENATDNLYIDFNAIIHNSSSPRDGPNQDSVEGIMKNIAKNLDQIIDHVRPTKLLYISTDGVAPRAKLVQQRARRYKSVHEKELEREEELRKQGKNGTSLSKFKDNSLSIDKVTKKESCSSEYRVDFSGLLKEIDSDEKLQSNTEDKSSIDEYGKHLSDIAEQDKDEISTVFDSNAITPGTKFMFDLEIEIDKFIQRRLKTHENYKNLAVIYSNGRRPGEGEQKIMNVIRKTKNKNTRHTIFSPDADLIFLGCSLHGRFVKIMREDMDYVQTQKKYLCDKCGKEGHLASYCNNFALASCVFIDINRLKKILHEEFRLLISIDFDVYRMIDDWILMSFLAGNDFLPSLQCFDVRFEAIEVLTRLLARNYSQTKRYITHNGELNFQMMINFFRILSEDEDLLYSRKKADLDRARARYQAKGHFENIPLDTTYGKTKYYNKKLKLSSEKDVIRVCRDYLLGLSWVLAYYIKGTTHWEWYYPHDYAPFAIDICTIRNMPYLANKTKPLDSLEQQVFVMPPQSRQLLPKEMHDLFDNLPSKIEIDMFDKLLPWQGVILLPMVDFKDLLAQIKRRRAKINYEDILPSLDSNDLFYITKTSTFNKIVGNIKENRTLFDSLKLMYERSLPHFKTDIEFDAIFTPFYQYYMMNENLVVTYIQE